MTAHLALQPCLGSVCSLTQQFKPSWWQRQSGGHSPGAAIPASSSRVPVPPRACTEKTLRHIVSPSPKEMAAGGAHGHNRPGKSKAMAGERPLAPRFMPRLPHSLPFVITAEPPKYPCQKHVRFQPQPGSDKECSIWSPLEAACSCFSPCRRSLGSRAVVLRPVPSGEN